MKITIYGWSTREAVIASLDAEGMTGLAGGTTRSGT